MDKEIRQQQWFCSFDDRIDLVRPPKVANVVIRRSLSVRKMIALGSSSELQQSMRAHWQQQESLASAARSGVSVVTASPWSSLSLPLVESVELEVMPCAGFMECMLSLLFISI